MDALIRHTSRGGRLTRRALKPSATRGRAPKPQPESRPPNYRAPATLLPATVLPTYLRVWIYACIALIRQKRGGPCRGPCRVPAKTDSARGRERERERARERERMERMERMERLCGMCGAGWYTDGIPAAPLALADIGGR